MPTVTFLRPKGPLVALIRHTIERFGSGQKGIGSFEKE
jgi:hypothetical protein